MVSPEHEPLDSPLSPSPTRSLSVMEYFEPGNTEETLWPHRRFRSYVKRLLSVELLAALTFSLSPMFFLAFILTFG